MEQLGLDGNATPLPDPDPDPDPASPPPRGQQLALEVRVPLAYRSSAWRGTVTQHELGGE